MNIYCQVSAMVDKNDVARANEFLSTHYLDLGDMSEILMNSVSYDKNLPFDVPFGSQIVADFDPERATKIIDDYYGAYPSNKVDINNPDQVDDFVNGFVKLVFPNLPTQQVNDPNLVEVKSDKIIGIFKIRSAEHLAKLGYDIATAIQLMVKYIADNQEIPFDGVGDGATPEQKKYYEENKEQIVKGLDELVNRVSGEHKMVDADHPENIAEFFDEEFPEMDELFRGCEFQ